jgi:hypothetical protein
MKSIITFFFLLFSCLLYAQDISSENLEEFIPGKANKLIKSFYSENDHVIAFRVKLTDKQDEESDYFILTKKEDKLIAYTYSMKTSTLKMLDLTIASLDLIWKTFLQNDLFKIRDEKDIQNFCPEKYRIYHSYTYEFIIFSMGQTKKISYYDPEYYDNACYGIAERRKVINSASVINYVINK